MEQQPNPESAYIFNLLEKVYDDLMQEAKEVKNKDEWLIGKMTGIQQYKKSLVKELHEQD